MAKEDRVRGSGRVAFWARKDQINTRIEQGYPLTWIYDDMKGKMNIGYGQFCLYVKRYISEPKKEKEREEMEQDMAADECISAEQRAIREMHDICAKLIDTFIDSQDHLPEKYGRLAGFVKGFVAAQDQSS